MFRWKNIESNTYYRKLFTASKTIKIVNEKLELDHYAFRYLNSELEMYKILDVNFVNYIEKRGNIVKLPYIDIPSEV